MIDVQVIANNVDEWHMGFEHSLLAGLEKIGLEAEGDAKELCPVDTGRLRNSITHKVDKSDHSVYIGTNVEYAVYVELDDSKHHKVGQAHFLRDAARNHSDNYRLLIKGELEKGY